MKRMTIMGTIAASMSAFLVCAAEFDPVAFIEDSLARGEKTVGGCGVRPCWFVLPLC